MSEAPIQEGIMTEEEYLATEELSPIRREYLGGYVYGMSGASEAHNIISANLSGLLYNQLRGKRCRSFGADMRLRIRRENPLSIYYYYPDAMIVCDATERGKDWRERPTVLFEILSRSTRRTDEQEKRPAYHGLPTLEAYVRIERSRAEVLVERRLGSAWQSERLTGLEKALSLPSVEVSIPLGELYEDVLFRPERTAEEEA